MTYPLSRAAGRILAEEVRAGVDLPPFDNSSVDGFAIRIKDIQSATSEQPRMLKVVADIHAGDFYQTELKEGQAARIMTGAALPPGAEAVVMVEDTDFSSREAGTAAPKAVSIYKSLRVGENVRHRGDDLHSGQIVLEKGKRLRAQELGLLAMLGIAEAMVHRPPKLALLSSGDELLPVEEALTPGKIHDSNTSILTALAEKAGAELLQLGVAKDSETDVRARLDRAVDEKADLIVSSAGVSVGAFDYVKTVVESAGSLDFWKVDMRPGKPLAFGEYKGIPFFGLPGNPVSAFVGFLIFVRPALEKLAGTDASAPLKQKARLLEAVESDGRESYLRGIVKEEGGQLTARLSGHQGSGNIFSLVQANALLILASGVKSLPANSDIEVWLIE
jgi:molybdopterin molybdotransferase